MYLLGKIFFKLFFHWSADIRGAFYNFLIVRIGNGGQNNGLSNKDKKISVNISRNIEKMDDPKRLSADYANKAQNLSVILFLCLDFILNFVKVS